jgi:cell shape-determining protein MreC
MARSPLHNQVGAATHSLVIVVALAALLGSLLLLFGSHSRQRAQQAELAASRAELASLRQQTAELERLSAQNQQLQQLKEDNKELVKLRGEVSALRPLKAQAERQQTLDVENQQLKAQLRQLQADLQQTTSLRNQNQQLQSIITERMEATQAQTCVAYLRSIEAAKTAWATDFQKRPVDVPVDTDLFGPQAYLPAKPVCPAKGAYTLGAVQDPPACSIPGHAY